MAAISGSAVALALLVAVPSTASAAAEPGRVLVRQQATLTSHVSGLPEAGTPDGRRLAKAVIDIEVIGDTQFIDAHVDLVDFPTGDPDGRVSVQFGYQKGAGCEAATGADEWATTDSYSWSYHLFGQSPDEWGPKPTKPWDCAFAVVTSLDGTDIHDALIGSLTNSYEAPRLRVGQVSVLGQQQKRLKISTGGWTPVEVAVRNTGTRRSGKVTVSGKGKGLQVKSDSAGVLRDGARGSAVLLVRPKGKQRPGSLTITAKDKSGVQAKRTIRVKRVPPPRKPVAGRYRNQSGTVSFAIRKGRITGFRVTTQTRCGGYGTPPQYTQDTYDFPKVRIPRHGIVTASTKRKAGGVPWSARLRAKVAGGKVTRGLFEYAGPGGCSAAEGFTATRVGK